MLEITNNSTNSVVLWDPVFDDELITFGGAGTLLAGTILARDSASLKMIPFVKGGSTNEDGIPKALIRDDLTATGAGDLPCRVIISGRVRLSHLVIDADQDNSNVDKAVIDQMRDFTIVTLPTQQLAELDNQ